MGMDEASVKLTRNSISPVPDQSPATAKGGEGVGSNAP